MKTSPLADLFNQVNSTSIPRQLLPYLEEIEQLQALGISLKKIGQQLGFSDKQIYWALPRAQKIKAKMLTVNTPLESNTSNKDIKNKVNSNNPFKQGKFINKFNNHKEHN